MDVFSVSWLRFGRSVGLCSATLDTSLYAGLRAEQSRLMLDASLHEVAEGVPVDGTASSTAPSLIMAAEPPVLPSYVKPVVKTATDQTASVRTAGTASVSFFSFLFFFFSAPELKLFGGMETQ